MKNEIRSLLIDTCGWIATIIVVVFFFTLWLFSYNNVESTLKEAWSITFSALSALTTFGAAIVAAYLFNDWKEQESIIFKRNLAYTIFNDMVLLLRMMMDPKHEQHTVSSLQSQFTKILYDIVLYSKNESKAKTLIEEFGILYTKQLGIFQSQKEGEASTLAKDHLKFMNEYNTILHTCSELVDINISSEDINAIFKVMVSALENSSDLESIKQNTNRILNKVIKK